MSKPLLSIITVCYNSEKTIERTIQSILNQTIIGFEFIIIDGNKITATRTVLPLSDKELPTRFGLRHRAAVGITEKTDALCLVVSEETGKISYIKDGEFELFKNHSELIEKLKSDMN